MPSKSNRTLHDFFKPFAQPKIKRISVTDQRSASEPQDAITTKVRHDVISRPTLSPTKSASDLRIPKAKPRQTDDPSFTPVSSSPSSKSINRKQPVAVHVRELSPLPSLSPSASPSPPSPPPTVPQRRESALLAPVMDPSVSSSSLSSLPVSSQSSSKRVIRDGMLAVTNSDSDSIDDGDFDPLDDIDELIRRKRLKMTPPAPSSETPKHSSTAARGLRSSTRRERRSNVKARFAQPPQKTYKFSLASLVASSAKDAASNQRIQQFEDEHQKEIDETARLGAQLMQSPILEAEDFAARLQTDDGDIERKDRLVQAIKRNDVLQSEIHYRFFRSSNLEDHEPCPFPDTTNFPDEWRNLLEDQASREESFRSGLAADMASIFALPSEVVHWVLSALLQDLEPDLADGYIGALKNSYRHDTFATHTMRRQLLVRAGRKDLEPDFFHDPRSIPQPTQNKSQTSGLPLEIRGACSLLGKLADRLDIEERRSWLSILILLLSDFQLEQRLDLQVALQTCIMSLLEADRTPLKLAVTIEHVGTHVMGHLASPVLIDRLLRLLPSFASASHAFKRRVALASFMNSKAYLTNNLEDQSTMREVALYLRENGRFKIRDDTDFSILGAQFGILDVAIGLGLSRFDFGGSELASKTDSPVGIGPVTYRLPLSDEEVRFNSAVDDVVGGLRSIAFNIRDSGATHMRRTECKTAIEKLSYRLEFSARTKPKPRKGIFGESEGATDMMMNFIGSRDQGVATGEESGSN